MFAICALVTFLLALLLGLFGGDTGKFSLLYLGLAFVAAHLIWTWAPWRRG
jgi:hypothetical protein